LGGKEGSTGNGKWGNDGGETKEIKIKIKIKSKSKNQRRMKALVES
jgi:hypothetical protein